MYFHCQYRSFDLNHQTNTFIFDWIFLFNKYLYHDIISKDKYSQCIRQIFKQLFQFRIVAVVVLHDFFYGSSTVKLYQIMMDLFVLMLDYGITVFIILKSNQITMDLLV